MAKSRARFLSELLGTTGLVKKSKSALAGADEIIDLSTLPSIPNSKLTNSSITINSSATSLGGSVTLTTANVAENTNLYYTDARADARIAAADTGDLSEGSNLYYTNARADARIAAADTGDLSEGSNLYYTDARADARVALVIDSAPSTLNTLNELAAALGDDASFSTTVTNSIAAKLPLTGGTLTGNLSLGDNVKAQFGASDDLEIFSNGSTALLKAGNATSDIRIESDNRIVIADRGFNEAFAVFNDDSDVKLYHDGSQKLSTTSTGIDVTGTATMDGLVSVLGSDAQGKFSGWSPTGSTSNAHGAIELGSNASYQGIIAYDGSNNTRFLFDNSWSGTGSTFEFRTNTAATAKTHLKIEGSGDISFYEDTGTTPKFFWDASTERLGLGVTNPSRLLHLQSNGPDAYLRLNSTGNESNAFMEFGTDDTTWTVGAKSNESFVFNNGTERLTINADGSSVFSGSVTVPYLATTSYLDLNNSGNRGKIGWSGNHTYIATTSSVGSIIFKNNVGSTDAPQTSGDTLLTLADGGNATFTGDVVASRLKTEGTEPTLFFNDTTTGHDDWKMYADWDQFQIQQYVNDSTWTSRLHFAANGNATFSGSVTATVASADPKLKAAYNSSNYIGISHEKINVQGGGVGLIIQGNGVDRATFASGGGLTLANGNLTLTSGSVTSTGLTVNGGSTNVVANFVSTDGIAGIKLQDNNGNVELSASGSTFRVQPSGNAPVFEIDSSGNTDIAGTIGSGAITSTGAVTGTYFSDGYVTWNAAQFNRSGAAIEFQFTPTNANWKVKIGANGDNPTEFNAYTGDADFSGEVSTPSAKLKAIAESNTDTAVDVFVYDTRKDSDGGAWRKRTQHTSWYNETLNTSTRGARKEFPCVAVIVVESNEVTIYDGDDPDMPMWMTFPVTNSSWLKHSGSGGCKAVVARDGIMVTGGDIRGSIVRFVADDGNVFETGYNYEHRYITTRNGVVGAATGPIRIVNNSVNDVAMTVLPNAPIDADTGLPVPTIAVATNGGVSIIRDNGTVVDIVSSYLGHETPMQVRFIGDKVFWLGQNNYDNGWSSAFTAKIPSADLSVNYNTGVGSLTKYSSFEWGNASSNGSDISIPIAMNSPRTSVLLEAGKNDELIFGGKGSDDHGTVVKVVENLSDPESGMIAQIASDYNTGYQVGDIKLAALSDTDTTTPASTNLVTNGTFASASNWTQIAGSSTAITGGAMVFTNGGGYGGFYQSLGALTAGKSYTLSFDVTSFTTAGAVFTLADTAFGVSFSGTGSYSFVTAPIVGSDPYIRLYATAGGAFTIDNVSVVVAESDHSANGNGLQVFGTLSKDPVATGAELVGYSGWHPTVYLQQPVNTDFAGAYDYSFSCWSKTSSTSAYQYLFSVGNPASATGVAGVAIRVTDGVLYHYDDTNSSGYSTTNVANGVWNHIVVNIKNGVSREYYVNGVSVYSQSISAHTIASAPKYTVALYTGNALTYHHQGSMALQRFGKTLPSAEQIAKMYNDEKHLFQTNAKATLYGSSNAVTALAYDDDTNLLHAGTSAGRSVFQGLNRVDNTTDAVGVAISASNGFIVEE
jgi:hypothetical protein